MNRLLDILDDGIDEELEKQKKHNVLLNLIKRLYFELDIYSSSLIYIWLDDNRVKISMDGLEKFSIKKGTKFSHFPDVQVSDIKFKNFIKEKIQEFLKKRDIDIFSFYMDDQKVIFKIKKFAHIDIEKCLY